MLSENVMGLLSRSQHYRVPPLGEQTPVVETDREMETAKEVQAEEAVDPEFIRYGTARRIRAGGAWGR